MTPKDDPTVTERSGGHACVYRSLTLAALIYLFRDLAPILTR